MVVGRAGTRTTSPTKLIAAKAASHVVAARILLNSCPAHRAERDIVLVLIGPPCKLLFHSLFTRDIFSVPLVTTLEANFCLAFGASHLFSLFVFRSHMSAAARVDAPAHQRISIELLLLLEFTELCC